MIGERHTRCCDCGSIIPKGSPKVSVGGRWRCPDCEYKQQQLANSASTRRSSS